MKYNKSQIMKAAWIMFRQLKGFIGAPDFAECLRRAWAKAKAAVEDAKALAKNCCKIINGGRCYMNRGVVAEAGRMGWNVTGSTYYARKELKRMGFFFDGETRCWATQDADVAAAFLHF